MLLIMTSKMIFIAWRMKTEKNGNERKGEKILRESFELLLVRLNEQHRKYEK